MQDDKNVIFQMRFPQKLWYLLNMRTDAILWGGTGRTILLNYRILHNYLQCDHSIFKTTNISSFVRQLNLYGFRKVTSHLQDPLCNSCNPYMHEYVHDYFQYGRPELLNKITRKALALRKSFKPKSFLSVVNIEQLIGLTPLQKARRTFHEALRKAAHDLFLQNNPAEYLNFDNEESHDVCDNEENIELDWPPAKSVNKNKKHLPQPAKNIDTLNYIKSVDETNKFGDPVPENNLMTLQEDSNQQNNDFPSQFLSMPDLDPEPHENDGVELLAEFKIDCVAQHEKTSMQDGTENEHISLNCVLPSLCDDPNDEVTMSERHIENEDNYNGEWDQMFTDMINNKGNSQECGSDLKELYSQISRTIDLLNV